MYMLKMLALHGRLTLIELPGASFRVVITSKLLIGRRRTEAAQACGAAARGAAVAV